MCTFDKFNNNNLLFFSQAPLAKTDEIVLLGGSDRTTSEVNKLVSQLPPAVSALTGVDLTGVSR